MRDDISSPRWPAWLLERLLPTRALTCALGDLAEEYVLRAQANRSHVPAMWYWMQIGRSLPALFGLALRSAGTIRTLLVAVVAYLSSGVVEGLMNSAIGMLALSDPVRGVAGVFSGLTAIAGAGYVAARIQPPAAFVMAVLNFAVVAVLMFTSGHMSPLVYQLAFLIGAPVASIAGGAVAARRPSQPIP